MERGPPQLVDRRRIAEARRRAVAKGDTSALVLIDWVVRDIAERLQALTGRFERALVVGDPTAGLARAVLASGRVGEVARADWLVAGTGDAPRAGLVIDDERLMLPPQSVDLFVSALTLQFANDLPGALIQIRRVLKPDGLLLASFIGGDTLSELRSALLEAEIELTGGASARVLPFADLRDVGALLQRAGFALPVADLDRLTLRYDSAFALMHDLRAMAASGVIADHDQKHCQKRRSGPADRRLFLRAAEIYAARFADPDGRLRATFTILSASGWCPSGTQPKPARPGSATVSLKDVLGR